MCKRIHLHNAKPAGKQKEYLCTRKKSRHIWLKDINILFYCVRLLTYMIYDKRYATLNEISSTFCCSIMLQQ